MIREVDPNIYMMMVALHNVENNASLRRWELARNQAAREIREKYDRGRFRTLKLGFMMWLNQEGRASEIIREQQCIVQIINQQADETVVNVLQNQHLGITDPGKRLNALVNGQFDSIVFRG